MALRYFLTLDVFDDNDQLVYQETSEAPPQDFLAAMEIDVQELEALPDAAHLHFLEQARAGVEPAEALEAAKAFTVNAN